MINFKTSKSVFFHGYNKAGDNAGFQLINLGQVEFSALEKDWVQTQDFKKKLDKEFFLKDKTYNHSGLVEFKLKTL